MQCTAIHQGPAHLYPIENVLFTVELHTNASQFLSGDHILPVFTSYSHFIEWGRKGGSSGGELESAYEPWGMFTGLHVGCNWTSNSVQHAGKRQIGYGGSSDFRGRKELLGWTGILMVYSMRETQRDEIHIKLIDWVRKIIILGEIVFPIVLLP